jgi:CcmD family protein
MDNASWLTGAFALAWLGLGVYVSALLLRVNKLEKRLRRTEARDNDEKRQ